MELTVQSCPAAQLNLTRLQMCRPPLQWIVQGSPAAHVIVCHWHELLVVQLNTLPFAVMIKHNINDTDSDRVGDML